MEEEKKKEQPVPKKKDVDITVAQKISFSLGETMSVEYYPADGGVRIVDDNGEVINDELDVDYLKTMCKDLIDTINFIEKINE